MLLADESSDEADAGDDEEAEQDFEGADAAFFEQGLGEGGEEGDGRHAGEADGDVRELHRAEEADPVEADDEADGEVGECGAFAGPEGVAADERDPGCCADGGEEGAPDDQPRCGQGDQLAKDRRGGEEQDEEVELEVVFQGARAPRLNGGGPKASLC